MMLWLLVITTVPGAFVVGCAWGWRATAVPASPVPEARVVSVGPGVRLANWTYDAVLDGVRGVFAGGVGVIAAAADILFWTALAG